MEYEGKKKNQSKLTFASKQTESKVWVLLGSCFSFNYV